MGQTNKVVTVCDTFYVSLCLWIRRSKVQSQTVSYSTWSKILLLLLRSISRTRPSLYMRPGTELCSAGHSPFHTGSPRLVQDSIPNSKLFYKVQDAIANNTLFYKVQCTIPNSKLFYSCFSCGSNSNIHNYNKIAVAYVTVWRSIIVSLCIELSCSP